MKATGIVRRVDDLGRIVIPKEIRRTLKIREGDPLEIYTEKDGGVIFRKYSPMGDLQDFASQICDSIGSNTGRIAAVSDRDSIIALAGAPKRELMDKPNSQELDNIMQQRKNYRYMPGDTMLKATESSDKYHLGVAAPILCQGDLMGCVMLLMEENDAPLAEADQQLAQTVAGFLGKQMAKFSYKYIISILLVTQFLPVGVPHFLVSLNFGHLDGPFLLPVTDIYGKYINKYRFKL